MQHVQMDQLSRCFGFISDHRRSGRFGQSPHATPPQASVDGGRGHTKQGHQPQRPQTSGEAKLHYSVCLSGGEAVSDPFRPARAVLQTPLSFRKEALAPPVEGGAADPIPGASPFTGAP